MMVAGFGLGDPDLVAAAGRVRFTIAKDAVETPLFYREVILPFKEAVKEEEKPQSKIEVATGGQTIEGEIKEKTKTQ